MASFKHRPTADLVAIALAGGGFLLDAENRPTDDLVHIARSAQTGSAKVVFRGLRHRSTAELLRIAEAGSGVIVLEGDSPSETAIRSASPLPFVTNESRARKP